MEDLERFRSFSFTNAGPIEHFNVLIKKPYRVASWWTLTRTHETVESVSGVSDMLQWSGRDVH